MKNTKNRKTRFILIISLLLIIGFSSTSFISYFVANNSLKDYVRTNTLPLTSDNVYSEIQRDVLPTIIISSLMAQDTFVLDWVLGGEKNPDEIARYLKSIQDKYRTSSAFYISEKTRNYYHSKGLIKKVEQNNPADAWYFRIDKLESDFEVNVDRDTADPTQTNVFVNHKVMDYKGNYIGAIGVGLSSNVVSNLIEDYQNRYARQVYFIDTQGKVTLRGKHYQDADTIFNTPGLAEIADQILANAKGSYIYSRSGQDVLLNTRFIPELSWYLLVEQMGTPEEHIQKTLWINLTLSSIITVIVLLITYFTFNQYQQRLITLATKDNLTGLNNRHGFEPAFQLALRSSIREKEPLSLALIDIDNFKMINDQYGHLIGDQVLIIFARVLKESLRDSDLLCRWGGEEFMILLPKCNSNAAALLADKIRLKIEREVMKINGRTITVTASFGVTQRIESESHDALYTRVDKALYKAKNLGRNRVEQF